MKRKTCIYCKKIFFTTTQARKFCTDKCRNAYHTPDVYLSAKICQRDGCRNPFHPKRSWQKYCSTECQKMDSNIRNDATQKLREQRARMKAEVEARIAMMHSEGE